VKKKQIVQSVLQCAMVIPLAVHGVLMMTLVFPPPLLVAITLEILTTVQIHVDLSLRVIRVPGKMIVFGV